MEQCERHPEKYLRGRRILPQPIRKNGSVASLARNMFAYNGGRLQAACRLLEEKYSEQDVTIGLSLAGALTPAGLGVQAIIPLMNHGFVDWIVSTGANMYHDLHFAFDLPLHQGSHNVDDKDLRAQGVTRIYDVLLDYQKVLMATDWDLREFLLRPEFQQEMSTQVFYHHLGELANQVEEVKYKDKETKEVSILAAAYRNGIPVFTSSPGDSTIGMNIAGLELIADALNLGERFKLRINPSRDVNESTAIVFNAKVCEKKKTGVILIGGGSPKNFMLQTEPQIQEVLGIPEVGQDYDINVTDARPDTGGLSGAPPSEAVSWGKINADKLEESVVVYADATIVLPLMVQYAIDTTQPKQLKRLYERREELYEKIKQASIKHHPHVRKLEELMRALLPTRRND